MRGAAQALHFAREELLFLPSQVLFLSPIALLQGVKGWGSNITSFSFILFGICIAQSLSLSLFLCKLTRFQKKKHLFCDLWSYTFHRNDPLWGVQPFLWLVGKCLIQHWNLSKPACLQMKVGLSNSAFMTKKEGILISICWLHSLALR